MKGKRIPGTGTITKYKARFNAHGRQQEIGEKLLGHMCPSCQLDERTTHARAHSGQKLQSRSIDFTLAYFQAGLNINIVPTVARQLI
jgi:hypothetical protein